MGLNFAGSIQNDNSESIEQFVFHLLCLLVICFSLPVRVVVRSRRLASGPLSDAQKRQHAQEQRECVRLGNGAWTSTLKYRRIVHFHR